MKKTMTKVVAAVAGLFLVGAICAPAASAADFRKISVSVEKER